MVFFNKRLKTIEISVAILITTIGTISCVWPTAFPKFPIFGKSEEGAVTVTTGVNEVTTTAKVKGELVPLGQAKFMALILSKIADKTYNSLCSASVIDEYHFLTSAFCCTGYDKSIDISTLYVLFGGDYFDHSEEKTKYIRRVKELKIHPDYYEPLGVIPNRIIHDYCVGVLETPIELGDAFGVLPVKLAPAVSPAKQFYEEKLDINDCWSIGFGRGSDRGPIIEEVYGRLKKIRANFTWPQSDIEAIHLELPIPSKETDQYLPYVKDFGSPFLCRLKSESGKGDFNNAYMTIGVLSGEVLMDETAGIGTVYEPVALFREWIDEVVLNETKWGLFRWILHASFIILFVAVLMLSIFLVMTKLCRVKARITTVKKTTSRKSRNSSRTDDDGATTTNSISRSRSNRKNDD